MIPAIEHVQNIIEDRLIEIGHEVQRFSIESDHLFGVSGFTIVLPFVLTD